MRQRVLLFLACLLLQTALHAELLPDISNASAGFTENKGHFRDQNGHPNLAILYMADFGGMKVQLHDNGFSYEIFQVKPQWVDPASIPYRIMTVSDRGDTVISWPGQAEAMKNLMYHYHRIDIRLEACNPLVAVTAELKETDGGRRMLLEGASEIAETNRFGQIRYREIYPGIDMVCYAINPNGGFKYDFILHPGADPSLIRLNYAGADDLVLNDDGVLEIKTRFGSLTESIPLCYAEDVAGIRTPVEGIHYQLSGNTLKFKGTAAQNRKIVIDPAVNLHWAAFFGGDSADYCSASVIDALGNTYLCGGTKSPANIATTGSYQDSLLLPEDGFLTKYSNEGQLLWSTYLNNTPAVDLDIQNNLALLTGNKIMKFDTDGTFLWQINSMHGLKAICLDQSENIVVVGDSTCPDYGVTFHMDTIVKYNSSGILQWAGSFGDSNTYINDVGLDTAGNIYFAGLTMDSAGIGTSGSHLENYNGTKYIGTGYGYDEFYKDYQVKSGDGFFAKMTGDGQLVFGSYYGGYFYDEITKISVSDSGYFVVAGTTNSRDGISTPGSFQDTLRPQGVYCFRMIAVGFEWDCPDGYWQYIDTCLLEGPCFHPYPMYDNHCQSTDAFFTRFRPDGTRQWGTYYGDTDSEFEAHVEINPAGDTIIVGGITTGNGPIVYNYGTNDYTYYDPNLASTYAYNTNHAQTYLAQFNAAGQRMWGTYFPNNADAENNLGYWHISDVNIHDKKVIVTGTAGSNYIWGNEGMNAFVFSFALSDLDTIYEADPACECAGESTVLSVGVLTDPTADLDFQWMFNGLPVAGATDSILVINNTSPSDTGFYYCNITQGDFSWKADSVNVGVRENPAFDKFSGKGQNPSLPDSRYLGDLDNDGDLDVIRQEHIVYNDSLAFIRNDSIPALYDQVSLVDIFNDQDLFIFTHDSPCLDWPTCTRPSKFIRVQNGLLDVREDDLIDKVIIWADFDNDGKVEGLKSVGFYNLFLVEYENDTIYERPAGSVSYNIWAGSSQRMQAVDYDYDGDVDVAFVGTSVYNSWIRSTSILVNTGGIFQELLLPELVHYRDANFQWFDADADGDLDYLFSHSTEIDNHWYKILSVYTSDSGVFTPSFTDTISFDVQQDIFAPQIVDFDNDGLFDIVVKKTLLKKTDTNYVILPSTYNIAHSGLTDWTRSYGDFDNDGDSDILGENGLFTNDVCNINTPPSAPSGLSAISSNDTVTFSWQLATDLETPQPGLTYNLRVGITPGGNEIMSSMSDSTGWRKIAGMGNVYQSFDWWLMGFQPGTYYWSVQAIDNSYAGGSFAEEQSFSLYALSTTWTGAIDSLWNKPGNWSDGIPGENTTVIIPGEPVNQPILNISTANKKLKLQTGSELIINPYKQLNLSDSLIINQDSPSDSTKLIIKGDVDILTE